MPLAQNESRNEPETTDPLSTVFKALADPTRREMLRSLASGERTVSELARPFAMSLAAAAKHVGVLERAGLVQRTVRGRSHHCRLEPGGLAAAQSWLAFHERYWDERLAALADVLAETPGEREPGS